MRERRQAKRRTADGRRATGFTLVELLVVVAIILILMSLLLPSVGAVKSRAIRLKCQNNLRQILMASVAYAADHQGNYPERGAAYAPHVMISGGYNLNLSFVKTYLANARSDVMFCPGALYMARYPNVPGFAYQGTYVTYDYFNLYQYSQGSWIGTFAGNPPDLRRVSTTGSMPLWGCATFFKDYGAQFGHDHAGDARPLTGLNVARGDGSCGWVNGDDCEQFHQWSGNRFSWPTP